jgi:hypothetical protein
MAVVVPGVEEALNGGAEGGQIVKDAAPDSGPVQDREPIPGSSSWRWWA